jgi:hypothetical protein
VRERELQISRDSLAGRELTGFEFRTLHAYRELNDQILLPFTSNLEIYIRFAYSYASRVVRYREKLMLNAEGKRANFS